MALRSKITTRKPKKVRVTRSEAFMVNLKYLGDEPTFTKPLTRVEYAQALNWYNYMCDTKDAREYIETYLKNTNRANLAKTFKRVPDIWVPSTVAWVCRLLSKGFELPSDAKGYVEERLKETLKKAEKEETPKEEKGKVVSIQDRMKERASDIIGEIESLIDSGEQFSLYDWLKKNEIPSMYAVKIGDYYGPIWNEMVQAHSGKIDGYENWTKAQLKARMDFYNQLVSDAERYGSVTKKTRAPRKPRPVSTEKKLKNLKYQKESNEFKIASINPEKIIGAQELWTFNTKYKTVTVLRALDRGGLQVKGTSITNYDEKTSITKGTGRKPEIVLDKLQKGGKIVLRKLMDELKTDKALQYRINENTILMKVQ